MALLVNIDVPDFRAGIAFYTRAFGLTVKRHLGEQGAELFGWPVPVFLLEKAAGSLGAADSRRSYQRHWTSKHLDVVTADLESAVSRAEGNGCQPEWPFSASSPRLIREGLAGQQTRTIRADVAGQEQSESACVTGT